MSHRRESPQSSRHFADCGRCFGLNAVPMSLGRTLPSLPGAGSYGALSRPLKMFSECMRHDWALRPEMPAKNAPVAQLDRAPDYESGGQEFESLRARQQPKNPLVSGNNSISQWFRPAALVSSSGIKRCELEWV